MNVRRHDRSLSPGRTPVRLTSDGISHPVDPDTPLWLQTDASGELNLVSRAETLSSPALYLWGNFMDVAEAIVIYPDHQTLNTLAAVKADKLAGATSFDGKKIMPAALKDTSGLAAVVRNTVGGAAQSVELTRQQQIERWQQFGAASVAAQRRRGTAGMLTASSYIAFPASSPNMLFQPVRTSSERVFVPGNVRNWQADLSDGAVEFQQLPDAMPPVEGVGSDWDDFWNDVVNGIRKVVKVVVTAAEQVIHEITDDLGKLYRITVTCVEQAVALVTGFLKSVIGDIEKAVEWLSFLFEWDKVLAVKTTLHGVFTGKLATLSQWAKQQGDQGCQEIHKLFTAGERDIESLLAQSRTESVQSQAKNRDPQAFYGHKGARSYAKSRFLMDKFKQNGKSGSYTDTRQTGAGEIGTFLSSFVDKIKAIMEASPNLESIPHDLLAVIRDVSLLFSDPKAFAHRALSDILKLLVDVAVAILQLLDAVIETFIEMVADLIAELVSFLTRSIHIPVISDLWSLITNGDPLTILDVFSLIVAVPTYFIVEAIEAAEGSELGINLTANIGYMAVALFYAVMDALCDVFDMSDVPLYLGGYLAIGILQMILGFPTDFESDGAAAYVLYAFQAIPLLVTLGAILPRTKPLLEVTETGVLFMYGCTVFYLSLELAGKYPAQFALLTELEDIFGAIPYLAKPIGAGKGSATPRKIVLGAVDFVCDLTVFGMVMAQDMG